MAHLDLAESLDIVGIRDIAVNLGNQDFLAYLVTAVLALVVGLDSQANQDLAELADFLGIQDLVVFLGILEYQAILDLADIVDNKEHQLILLAQFQLQPIYL